MIAAAESSRIRSLRPAKRPVDVWAPLDVLVEQERHGDGRLLSTVTVFLAGAECPFTCVFCDLWQHTLDRSTPRGAIPFQLKSALDRVVCTDRPEAIKLYNASNFFEARAVPREDLEPVAELLRGFSRTTVECHPRLIGDDCVRFSRCLEGELEVAMGLETIHPEVLPRLNKQMSLGDFDWAASRLIDAGIGLRAFVLLSPPFMPAAEAVDWAVRSVDYAFDRGAGVVSLIPARAGNGEMDRLLQAGQFVPPSLRSFELALERSMALGRGVVLADLWDIERLSGCRVCRGERIERLRQMHLAGRIEPTVRCLHCSASQIG